MKNIHNIKKGFFAMFLLAAFMGCTEDFEEINQNPNFPEQASIWCPIAVYLRGYIPVVPYQ